MHLFVFNCDALFLNCDAKVELFLESPNILRTFFIKNICFFLFVFQEKLLLLNIV